MANNSTSAPQVYPYRSTFANGGQYNGMPIKEDFESEEDWRKACYQRLFSKNANRMFRKHAMQQQALSMYNATTDTEEIPVYATIPGSDVATSAVPYEHMNPLFAPMRKRAGVFKQAEITPNAKITNRAAKSRKEAMYVSDIMARAMGDARPAAEAILGESIPDPRIEMEAEGFTGPFAEYMNKKYRDYWERRAEKIINDWLDQSDFKSTLDQQYLIYILTQTAIFWPRVNPMTKKVEVYVEDPTKILYDLDMQDQHGRDMQWAIRYRYVSENEILHQYPQMTREKLREMRAFSTPSAISGNFLGWKEVDTTMYYMMAETRWIYTETITKHEAKLRTDIDVVPETEDSKGDIRYEEVYYSVMIGHYYELEGGRLENQVRSVDITSKANLGVFVLSLDSFIDPLAPTNTLRVSSYIRLRNMLFFKLSQQVSQMKGVFLEVDTSLLPEDQSGQPDYQGFMEQILGDRIVYKDSTQGGMFMDQAVSLRGQDMIAIKKAGMADEVNLLIGMINEITLQINTMLSINEAAVGTVGQYQNATTATMNLNAYQAAVDYEDKEFFRFTENVLTYIANLQKILDVVQDANAAANDNEEATDAVIIRNGDEYLEVDPEGFMFQDIGIKIGVETNSAEKRAQLNQYLMVGMQQGNVSLDEVITFQRADSVSEGLYELEQLLREKRRAAEAAAAQQMQMQQQMQAQQMQMQMQAQQQLEDQKLRADLAKQEQKKDLEVRNSNINTANNNEAQQRAAEQNFQQEVALKQIEGQQP